MNCDTFQDLMLEYRDETLTSVEQGAARAHLGECADCRRALAREETFAISVQLSLERETGGLTLRPELRRNIAAALAPQKVPEPIPGNAWEKLMSHFSQPAFAAVAVLCVAIFCLGIRFHLPTAKQPSPQGPADERRFTRAIRVPLQNDVYVFKRQNERIIDAFASSSSVTYASYSEKIEPSRSDDKKH